MSNLKEAIDGYLITDFKNKPVLALVALIGLGPYKKTILYSIDTYAPILTGIALYRHLPHLERPSVNKSILELEGSPLQSRLMELLTDLSVQPRWYMWSLSNDELMEFFSFNSNVESATGQFNPLSFADLSVANVALATYLVSKLGLAGALKHSLTKTANAVIKSDLLSAVAAKLGLSPAALGRSSLAALVVISGINIMAKYSSEKAKKELLARGLFAYSEI